MTNSYSHSRTSLVVTGLVIAAAALVAGRALTPSHPATVGVVNLESVFNESYVWANRNAELTKLQNDLTAKVNEKKVIVEALHDELKSFQQDSDAAVKQQTKVFAAIGEFNAQQQYRQLKIEQAKATSLRETYEDIQAIAKAYAKANGIDIVLVDDSIPEMKKTNSQLTIQDISLRRLLYATEEFEITADLLAQLNAKFPLNPGVEKPKPKSAGVANATGNTTGNGP